MTRELAATTTEWGGGRPAPKEPKEPCPHCGKMLRGRQGVRTHIIAKHGGKGKGAYKREEEEESFADRAVQAEIDRAAGIDNPDIDWLIP